MAFNFDYGFEEKLFSKTMDEALESFQFSYEDNSLNSSVNQFLSEQGLQDLINPKSTGEMNLFLGSLLMKQVGKYLPAFPVIENILARYIIGNQSITNITEESIFSLAWKASLEIAEDGEQRYIKGEIGHIPFANNVNWILVPLETEVVFINTDVLEDQFSSENSIDLTHPLYKAKLNQLQIDNESIFIQPYDHSEFKVISKQLIASELSGMAERVFQETLNYVKEREQFGVIIGKFQAVKHMLADMYLLKESIQTSIEYTAWSIENSTEDPNLLATISKTYASYSGVKLIEDAIQLHGGVGMTWEHMLHYYLKRAYRLSTMLGTERLEKRLIAG